MSTPDDFRSKLLHKLHRDARDGKGTDLEVLVPTTVSDDTSEGGHSPDANNHDETTSFHLHHSIVAANSRYFATFPEPKAGRIVRDLDSVAFAICVKFMYTGSTDDVVITPDCAPVSLWEENVASVLYASELLQIDGLKKRCIDYLDEKLCRSNHAQIIELADRFNCQDLKKRALRYRSENSTRDNLVAEKALLVKNIREKEYEASELEKKKFNSRNRLREVESELKEIFEKQHDQMLTSMWESTAGTKNGTNSDDSTSFEFGTGRKPGSISHIVRCSDAHEFDENDSFCPFADPYDGSSTYAGPIQRSNADAERSDGDADDSVDDGSVDAEGRYRDLQGMYRGDGSNPPPPPTRDEYESYGIIKAHSSIRTAIEASSAGDRIYLDVGEHNDNDDDDNESLRRRNDIKHIDKELEFIGWPRNKPCDIILEIPFAGEDHLFVVHESVAFFNVTFRATEKQSDRRCHDEPHTSQGTCDEAMITIDDYTKKATLIVKKCSFDLGCDDVDAHPTRIAGIYLKRGHSAIIEGCDFIGGAGSAIVALNDPFVHVSNIELTRNNFTGNGQPKFSEKASEMGFEGGQVVFKPIPSCKMTPGPAVVELWKTIRKRHKRHYKTVSIKMSANNFASNLRAPLVHRIITPCSSRKRSNLWQLHSGLDSGKGLNSILEGFDLLFIDNVLQDNGLSFDNDSILGMLPGIMDEDRKAKKSRVETSDQSESKKFPDGNSLLKIEHFISQFDQRSFPERWGDENSSYSGSGGDPFSDDEESEEEWNPREFAGGPP